MNLFLLITIISGLDVFFLKDSPDLLVRIIPEVQTEQLILYHSFSGLSWDSTCVKKRGKFFDAVIVTPEDVHIVGLYAVYDNGEIDDNDGALYLYEVKHWPKMIMPFSMIDLEIIISQARKKIMSGFYADEAITLLDYVEIMLVFVPIVKDSPNELKKNMLQIEVENLRRQLRR